MRIAFRWFGEHNDTISLKQIKQIPGVESIVWALHERQPGEVWPKREIDEVVSAITSHGFRAEVVESVNIHEDIKLGLPARDSYIENYKTTIENLAEAGVNVICYNFMPVFDWIRTDLNKPLNDESYAMFYQYDLINNVDPEEMVHTITSNPEFTMPGWEPERLKDIKHIIHQYENITADTLRENLHYFLSAIIPVCEKHGIQMAAHPDDPPWPVFGLPRILSNHEDILKLLHLVDSPSNGIALCSGSLGANEANNIPAMIREFNDRIAFGHVRNLYRFPNGDFIETSHRSSDGSIDIGEIMKAYHDIQFEGVIRPDHGRQIWEENCRPGYGLYDRALGIMYLLGIWDTLHKEEK